MRNDEGLVAQGIGGARNACWCRVFQRFVTQFTAQNLTYVGGRQALAELDLLWSFVFGEVVVHMLHDLFLGQGHARLDHHSPLRRRAGNQQFGRREWLRLARVNAFPSPLPPSLILFNSVNYFCWHVCACRDVLRGQGMHHIETRHASQ